MAILNFFVAIMLILAGLFAGFAINFDWGEYFKHKENMYKLHMELERQKGSE